MQLSAQPLGGLVLRVEFKPSRDSIQAFADDYVATSKAVQRQIFRMRLLLGLILLPWGLAYFWIGKPYAGIVMSAIPAILFLTWPRITAWFARRHLLRVSEAAKHVLWASGDTWRMQILNTDLLVSDSNSEGRIAVHALEALHETPNHVFIYTSPNTAITIERSGVVSGDLNDFVSALRSAMDAQAA